MEPARRERQPWNELMLHFKRVLDVPGPRIDAIRVQRDVAKRGRQRCGIDFAPGKPRRPVIAAPLALRDIVAVHVAPLKRGGSGCQRIVVAGDAGCARLVVPIDRVFQRRLRIAKKIVHRGETRRRIMPVGQILHRIEMPGRSPAARGRIGRFDLRVQPLVAQATGDRQPVQREGVLRVDADVIIQPLAVLRERGIANDDAIRA